MNWADSLLVDSTCCTVAEYCGLEERSEPGAGPW